MDKELIKQAVSEAIEEKLGKFFIEREQHYQDHLFVKDVREGIGEAKKTVRKTFFIILVTGILSLLSYGLIYLGKKHF